MQKLQEFIYNVLLFAQAVGAHVKDLRTRVYNLELLNLKPVQYVNQANTALERSIARNNIRTNAIFSGTADPNTINWGVLYEGMPLRDGDKYIQQDFAGGIREEYTYFVGDGTVLPTWLKVISSQKYFGTISDPNDTIPDGDFRAGDYYIETSDGTPGGDFVSIWLFTNLASGPQFVNPYGSQGPAGPAGPAGQQGETGPAGPAGPSGEDGEDGDSPYVGPNGNWWVGDIDTGVKAGLTLKTVYDSDISGIRNGVNNNFVAPDIFKPGTLKVYADGLLLTKGNNDDYIELLPGQAGNGATINRVLTDNNKLIFEYEVL